MPSPFASKITSITRRISGCTDDNCHPDVLRNFQYILTACQSKHRHCGNGQWNGNTGFQHGRLSGKQLVHEPCQELDEIFEGQYLHLMFVAEPFEGEQRKQRDSFTSFLSIYVPPPALAEIFLD
jgi:hypothetical protein